MIFHKPKKKFQTPDLNIDGINLSKCDTFNFLGLRLNQHLKWNDHIKYVSLRISRSLGQINALKHFLPTKILLTLYNTIVLPYFNYCILAWGSKNGLLTKMQKKAIRIATNSKYNAHTEPLLLKHNLLKLDDIYKVQQLKFYFKLKNRTLPAYFESFKITQNTDIHQHNTRSRHLFQQRVNHSFAQDSLRHNIIKLINNSPDLITNKVNTHSLQGFTAYIKTFYRNTYSPTCNIHDCYTCNNTTTGDNPQ